MLTPKRATSAALVAMMLLICDRSAFVSGQRPVPPLPLVERSNTGKGPFDRSALVVIGRVRERSQAEVVNSHGESVEPFRFWTFVRVQVGRIVRINERKERDPDLASGFFLLEQLKAKEKPVPLDFGKDYLLLVSPTQDVLLGSDAFDARKEWYELAVPQGGFTIVDNRLKPIVKGGELDAYSGKRLEDVLRELEQTR